MNRTASRPLRKGLALIAAAILGGGLLCTAPASAQEQGLENLRQTGQAFRSVAKKVSPAVVFIQVEQTITDQGAEFFSPFGGPGDEFFRRFFGQPPEGQLPRQQPRKRQSFGQGSGFIVTPNGYILTNNHVVDKADKVKVKMLDGREYTAKIVGADAPSDIAVIKIDESELPFLRLGDSDQLEVGDWVLAFGNPFGLSHTLTAGIVSAKGRSGMGINDYENFIQTDAAINPGNSGGPLVNLDGEVVGINSAIFSRSGGYMGIGFAIPVNMAKQVRDQLVAHGEVTRGRIGVYIQELTKDLAQSFGLQSEKGILVSQVIDDSPAQKAGIKRGDVVLRIDGREVGKVAEFRNRISMTSPGTAIVLTVLRDGKEKEVKVVIDRLAKGKDEESAASEESQPRLGLSLQALTPELAERLGYAGEKGVVVAAVEPGSAAAEAGIERGDLIQEIDRQTVTSLEQARKLLQSKKGGKHLLLVRRGEGARYLSLSAKE